MLSRYKEESLKDYKRIVLFLCTCEDLQQNASEPMEEEIVPPKHQKVVDMAVPGPSTLPGRAEALQIKNDQEIALAMQNEALNETEAHVNVNDNNNYYCDASTCDHEIKDEASVIQTLQKRVIPEGEECSMYIVVRRGSPLQRTLNLWKRAALKVSPEHVLRVKYIGEDGIDSGALAKEFLSNIGKNLYQ